MEAICLTDYVCTIEYKKEREAMCLTDCAVTWSWSRLLPEVLQWRRSLWG